MKFVVLFFFITTASFAGSVEECKKEAIFSNLEKRAEMLKDIRNSKLDEKSKFTLYRRIEGMDTAVSAIDRTVCDYAYKVINQL